MRKWIAEKVLPAVVAVSLAVLMIAIYNCVTGGSIIRLLGGATEKELKFSRLGDRQKVQPGVAQYASCDGFLNGFIDAPQGTLSPFEVWIGKSRDDPNPIRLVRGHVGERDQIPLTVPVRAGEWFTVIGGAGVGEHVYWIPLEQW
jgi:hypothetical protein